MENYEKYDKYLRYAMFAAYIANILVRKRQIAIYIVILVSFIIGMLSLILSENLTSDGSSPYLCVNSLSSIYQTTFMLL